MFDFFSIAFGSLHVLVALVLVLAAMVFWVYEFVLLMNCREDQFASPHDKILWVAAFLMANILGAIAYWCWKQMRDQPDSWVSDKRSPPLPPLRPE